MCSPFPQFLKPPGLNVPDIIIPDDMISNTSASVVPTGYLLLKPFLNEQQKKLKHIEFWVTAIAYLGLSLKH